MSLGGSGVSIGGVRSLRDSYIFIQFYTYVHMLHASFALVLPICKAIFPGVIQ